MDSPNKYQPYDNRGTIVSGFSMALSFAHFHLITPEIEQRKVPLKTLKQLLHGCHMVDIYLVNPNQVAINYYKMIKSSEN